MSNNSHKVVMTPEEFHKRIHDVTSPLPGLTPYRNDYTFSVKMKHNNWALIDFLVDIVPKLSREKWLDKIESGDLKVNNKPATPEMKLISGYRLTHTSDERTDPPVNPEIKLIYSDENFLVINKPAPLPMHPCGRFGRNTLINFLRDAYPLIDFKITHRIDANTTGLVVLAKNKHTATKIMRQFEYKQVHKEYLALAQGIIPHDNFESTSTIGTHTVNAGSRTLCENGVEAHTLFEVIERFPDANQTLLKVIPKSGRTNQIRLHLAGEGFPIVGDHGYHDSSYLETNPMTYDDDQLFLHAWKISFAHPQSGENISFCAPPPKKFPVK